MTGADLRCSRCGASGSHMFLSGQPFCIDQAECEKRSLRAKVEELLSGKAPGPIKEQLGFVMRALHGKANPSLVLQILKERAQ